MLKIQDVLAGMGVVELIEPEGPIPENANVIGDLPEELKRLYSLIESFRPEAEGILKKLDEIEEQDTDDNKDFLRQCLEHAARVKLITDIYDYEMKAVFGLFGERHYGVAAGWKVWTRDKSTCTCPQCTVERIMEAAPAGSVGIVMIGCGMPQPPAL